MRAEATVRKGSNLPFRGKGGKVRNRRVSPVAPRPGEGPLTEPTAGAQPWPRERVLMPHTCRSQYRWEIGAMGDTELQPPVVVDFTRQWAAADA
jgi:hypothetical protein